MLFLAYYLIHSLWILLFGIRTTTIATDVRLTWEKRVSGVRAGSRPRFSESGRRQVGNPLVAVMSYHGTYDRITSVYLAHGNKPEIVDYERRKRMDDG